MLVGTSHEHFQILNFGITFVSPPMSDDINRGRKSSIITKRIPALPASYLLTMKSSKPARFLLRSGYFLCAILSGADAFLPQLLSSHTAKTMIRFPLHRDRSHLTPPITDARTMLRLQLPSSIIQITAPIFNGNVIPVSALSALTGNLLLACYHLNLYRKERSGERTWRSAQADTREAWSKFVRKEEAWLYAIQTLRNAITAQTFLATTVLTLLTVIGGRLWDPTLFYNGANTVGSRSIQFSFIGFVFSMITSAYHFLQSARLMTHAGFMFPVTPKVTKVDRIMRRSQNSQWLGLRCLYISAGLLSWIVGGPNIFLAASILLTLFFRSIDKVPEGIYDGDDENIYMI